MKQLWIVLIPIILAYLTIVVGFVLFQRKLIYFPSALSGTTPEKFGLSFEDVRFKTSDGVTLNGWWIKHPSSKTPRPALLYCHGNAANLSYLAETARAFYDYGFDVFLFDYRGYGASQKAPINEAGLNQDALAAYQWLQSKRGQEGQIFIWGQSLGSGVASRLAAQTHPAGLILEGAFPSIYSMSREAYPWLLIPPFLVFDKHETEKQVVNLPCPLLMMHAEKDTIIPIKLGEKVFQKAREPKQWLVMEGINHNDFTEVAGQYQKPVMDFVMKSLAADSRIPQIK
jgi:fermentation-respiration switch protein FrsA (DUF1100 family)